MFKRFVDWLVKRLFPRKGYLWRDAKTGRIVSAEHAKQNPDTTYRDQVER